MALKKELAAPGIRYFPGEMIWPWQRAEREEKQRERAEASALATERAERKRAEFESAAELVTHVRGGDIRAYSVFGPKGDSKVCGAYAGELAQYAHEATCAICASTYARLETLPFGERPVEYRAEVVVSDCRNPRERPYTGYTSATCGDTHRLPVIVDPDRPGWFETLETTRCARNRTTGTLVFVINLDTARLDMSALRVEVGRTEDEWREYWRARGEDY